MLEHPEATAYNSLALDQTDYLPYKSHIHKSSYSVKTNNTNTEKFVPFEKRNGEIRYQSTSTGKLFYKEDDGTFKKLTLLHKLRALIP